MGQKVNPHGLRVGIIKDWTAKWYADKKTFADCLVEDNQIRKYLKTKLKAALISKIEIERKADSVKVSIHSARPGVIIGRSGEQINELKKAIDKKFKKDISLNIVEIKSVDLDSTVVAQNIASQLEKRISFRKAMKQSMQKTMKAGALGIKTAVSGRLGGAEIARTEHYHEGTIPLQTLRADIDYGFAEADTTYGKIGVKVWIYKGEVLPAKKTTKMEGGN